MSTFREKILADERFHVFQDLFKRMSEEDRVLILQIVAEPFCVHVHGCGRELNGSTCHCENDQ